MVFNKFMGVTNNKTYQSFNNAYLCCDEVKAYYNLLTITPCLANT